MTECVIGIDSSTQSTKAIAWDRWGHLLAEGRAPVPMTSPAPDFYEQEPQDWWQSAVTAIRHLGKETDLSSARGLAIANQRETVGFLDATGRSIRPAMVWLDGRAHEEAKAFSAAFGEQDFLALTGKHSDLTPGVYKLAWMRRHEPDVLDRCAQIVDVHGFLVQKLTSNHATSWTSADPSGLFDITAKQWSGPVLAHLGIRLDCLAQVHRPGTVLGHVSAAAAAITGLPAGLPVIAAGGDGQCAGLGVNAMLAGTSYLNLGTAVITGAWSQTPRVGKHWRTMVSSTGEGYFLEGVMRAGTFFVDWFVRSFVDQQAGSATFDRLGEAAMALPLGSEGVMASPYLSGCMNPHWEGRAKAAFMGLGPSHGQAHLYRAVLEAMTGEIARTIVAMRHEGVAIDRIVAVGGGANSLLWRRMLADATGLPLTVSASVEATSLGAAVAAAVAGGWYPTFPDAAAGMCRATLAEAPDPGQRAGWDALMARQDRLNRFVCSEAALGDQVV